MRFFHRAAIAFCAAFAVLLAAGTAGAGTEAFLRSGKNVAVSARNYDAADGRGYLRFSPAGVARKAQYAPKGCAPLAWTSKYASLSFNTYFDRIGPRRGSAFWIAGMDGLNAAGLHVGACFLEKSVFPAQAQGAAIDDGDFLQYLLDNFKSVDAALKDIEARRYAVTALPTPHRAVKLHYFLHDASGVSAVVEFLDGGMAHVVVNPDVPVLTDAAYSDALAALDARGTLQGKGTIPGGWWSQDRFIRTAAAWKRLPAPKSSAEAVAAGFALMQPAAFTPGFAKTFTQWTIVTDAAHGRVYFRSFADPEIARVDLAKLARKAKVVSDVDLLRTDLSGDVDALFDTSAAFNPAGVPAAPNYADPASWAALPAGKDRKPVDVFFVHPTTYFFPESWNESIEFGRRNTKVAASLRGQAGVFAASCNVYAPQYRDAHIKALGADAASRDKALAVAYADVERAFNHYLWHENHGRPFILAGHSQGSDLLLMLLKRRFGDAKLRKRLVAAYLVGWSVTAEDMKKYPFLKVSRGPNDVGAIVTYNTQTAHPGFSIVRPGAVGVNPLSMGAGAEAVGKDKNLGAVFFTQAGKKVEVPQFTGAQNVGGALVVPEIKSPYVRTPIPGFYHPYDYAIFYRNLERDVAGRIRAYLKAHPRR